MSIQSTKKFDANKAENHEDIEKQFAVVAVQHAQIYTNLLEKLEPKSIRLTRHDDEIYEDFQAKFPELFADNAQKVKILDEDEMKSPAYKTRWRNFMNAYKEKLADFNFGTLIRRDANGDYDEHNTIFVMRTQFLAYEISRNRLGFNDEVHAKAVADAVIASTST